MEPLFAKFFSKPTRQNIYREDTTIKPAEEGITGVAKYLQTQSNKPVRQHHYTNKLSSVGEYLNRRDARLIELTDAKKNEINIARAQRNIEENLMSVENTKLSGVAKYAESQEQALRDAQEQQQKLTGVTKYIANIIENKPAVTGVSRYLFNRVDVKVSGVGRYVINKSLADKNKPKVTILQSSSVTKYLKDRSTILTSSVAKYIAKQAVASKQVLA